MTLLYAKFINLSFTLGFFYKKRTLKKKNFLIFVVENLTPFFKANSTEQLNAKYLRLAIYPALQICSKLN